MNAFVTGGSRGVGRGIVLKFVQEGYGVAFTYVGNEAAAQETVAMAMAINPQAEVKFYRLDQADPAQCEAVADLAVEDFDTIDVLVNNAAINRNNAAALMSDEEWNDVLATNLSGPFYLIRQFLMPMLSQRFGRIINISSLTADGSTGQASYTASKAGLEGLTKTIAREYGSKGITANVVTVGFVPTQLTEEQMHSTLQKIWLEYCPAKRTGTPEEIAAMVHFLTTEHAGFINGEVIRVSGGLTYAP